MGCGWGCAVRGAWVSSLPHCILHVMELQDWVWEGCEGQGMFASSSAAHTKHFHGTHTVHTPTLFHPSSSPVPPLFPRFPSRLSLGLGTQPPPPFPPNASACAALVERGLVWMWQHLPLAQLNAGISGLAVWAAIHNTPPPSNPASLPPLTVSATGCTARPAAPGPGRTWRTCAHTAPAAGCTAHTATCTTGE